MSMHCRRAAARAEERIGDMTKDSFDFLALPSLNKRLVLELAPSDYIERRASVIAVSNQRWFGETEQPG